MARGVAEAQTNLLSVSIKVTEDTASNVAKRINQACHHLKPAMTKRIATCATIWITHIVVYAD